MFWNLRGALMLLTLIRKYFINLIKHYREENQLKRIEGQFKEEQCPPHQLEVQIKLHAQLQLCSCCRLQLTYRSPTVCAFDVPTLYPAAPVQNSAQLTVLRVASRPQCFPKGAPFSITIFLKALPQARGVKSEQVSQYQPILPNNYFSSDLG